MLLSQVKSSSLEFTAHELEIREKVVEIFSKQPDFGKSANKYKVLSKEENKVVKNWISKNALDITNTKKYAKRNKFDHYKDNNQIGHREF